MLKKNHLGALVFIEHVKGKLFFIKNPSWPFLDFIHVL